MRVVVPMNAIAKYIDFRKFGVGVFFIISGYLAFNSADLANGRVLKYYKKRTLRILPLFYVVILIWGILRSFAFSDMPEDPTGLYWLNYILLIFKVIQIVFLNGVMFEPLSDLCIFGLGILIYFAKKESQESKFNLFGCFFLILWIINLSDVKHMLFISIIMAIMIINSNVNNTTIEQIKVLSSLLKFLDYYSFDIYLSHPIVLYLVSTLGIVSNNTLLREIIIGILVLSIALDKISSTICSIIEKLRYIVK